MSRERIICFIDGYNLYHAIKRINQDHLKWVNLWALSSQFVKSRSQELLQVFYFSAQAKHMPESTQKRQNEYIKAITQHGVTPILGHFKKKERKCPDCAYRWTGHEEKETDVNIALTLIDLAHKNAYDHALLISNDSDLAPAIRMIRKNFPHKGITSISPPLYTHSNELIFAATNKTKIRLSHLERCLLPEKIYDAIGNVLATRPQEYSLPFANVKNL